ncbi:response regulator transcription factor [Methanococcus aeolicus]|uniref:response regulator transcription factor n=1 Tax=Methanococcus aeolicus TaxID=42879 RepID=UPI0021C599F7|nr:response regulator [Methanococcus aeolicus]UXM85009.1 response regulator [Methanococcus aeolicus]
MVKILVVEDNDDILNLIKIILELNNYEVIMASGGHEALNLLKNMQELPDLILLDIMMPEISGWDVLNIMKSNKKWKKIPVIILTALAQEKDIKIGMEKQVDGYITKPFEKKYLLEQVNELILKMQKDNK